MLTKTVRELKIKAKRKKLQKIFQDYTLYYFQETVDIEYNEKILTNLNDSEIITIKIYSKGNLNDNYFIISFKKTVILINQFKLSLINKIFFTNANIRVYFLQNTKDVFGQNISIENPQFDFDDTFNIEIFEFNKEFFIIENLFPHFDKINDDIKSCISGYLIQESYSKLNKKQNINFSTDFKQIQDTENYVQSWDETDYIVLRILGQGASFLVELIYYIQNNELYAIKKPSGNLIESEKLVEREFNNYLKINYPLLPKIYAQHRKFKYPIIQFINGNSLKKIENFHLNNDYKITIIFELLMTINYLHTNEFVYRDLKPNNVIIDENKNVFVIDFDRMVKISDNSKDQKHTIDFSTSFVDPDIYSGKINYANDIYSLGQMIYFIFSEKSPSSDIQNNLQNEFFHQNPKLLSIYKRCTEKLIDKRPTISELMLELYSIFYSQINQSKINNSPEIEYLKSIYNKDKSQSSINYNNKNDLLQEYVRIYQEGLINAGKNEVEIQYFTGLLYYDGKYIKRDINKAIHYFTQAANQNNHDAQFYLGKIYYEGTHVPQDVNKSINFLKLAADQNFAKAQAYLGAIYQDGIYVQKDISKSFYYYNLAANQNEPRAQFMLGLIYLEGKYVAQDISKTINYYTLSANQNFTAAQTQLGLIYREGKFVKKDINKAIHYLTLAADHNDVKAQFALGMIYFKGKDIKKDIDKAIHYYTLAAKQNFTPAQSQLALIYHDGRYVQKDFIKASKYYQSAAKSYDPRSLFALGQIHFNGQYVKKDINKAIRYISLAADQNLDVAQYFLGNFYYEGKYIARDINKAIHYFELAARQNFSGVFNILGTIYYENKYINIDINKAIYYYTLGSNMNDPLAQFNLGTIYYNDKDVPRDIYKAIHYLSLASKQNIMQANILLAKIYLDSIHITRDINKAIHYLTLAVNQNDPNSQYNLGCIFTNKKYDKIDINKAIHYYSLAANQNYQPALINLGFLYLKGEYIQKDIPKAIHYFTLAANQNNPIAQNFLGDIYYYHLKNDRANINKAIYYYSLSANQNFPDSQYKLGKIYIDCAYIVQDINKGLHYLTLAANQNHSNAQMYLGYIYYDGEYIKQDIEKAIHYLKLSADQNNSCSQLILGFCYYKCKNINKANDYFLLAADKNNPLAQYIIGREYMIGNHININKGILYLSMSANQNFVFAQLFLGFCYLTGFFIKENSNKGIDLLTQASLNRNVESNFLIGYFYHEGKSNKRDIKKSINYYKEASSFNNKYAKNNLGIIYKNGFGDEIEKNIGLAMVYFDEAIKRKNDYLSMYNLSHIFLFEDKSEEKINEAIKLLIKSYNQGFFYALNLLCIALVMKHGFDLNKIKEDLDEKEEKLIVPFIKSHRLLNEVCFKKQYNYLKNLDFVYNFEFRPFPSKNLIEKVKKQQNEKISDLTNDFYEGFLIDFKNI